MSSSQSDKSRLNATENTQDHITTNNTENSIFDLRTRSGKILLFIITLLISILIQFLPYNISLSNIKSIFLHKNENFCNINNRNIDYNLTCNENQPTYAIYGRSSLEDHLIHVQNVLKRFNYKRVSIDDNWNLLWAHDYPFRTLSKQLHNLNGFQKVNHIPGSGYITNKVDLSVTDLSFIPKAFQLPKHQNALIEYSNKNSSKRFVRKHNQHRHIHLISAENLLELDLNETFIQEFIENPYLVDGYKFDIGIYVIITSINPLRVYIYKGDVLFRFCPIKYYPFDPNVVDKYVVGDDYLPIWNVPSLKYYYQQLKFSMKESFDAYVRKQKQNPKIIWEQVENAIRSIILEKENQIVKVWNRFNKGNENFFELMRFDLIIDANLKVYLIEANMSPNLSSAHFKPNAIFYEQILYNVMNLIGIGSPVSYAELKQKTSEVNLMISDYKNIVVFPEICSDSPCTSSCDDDSCKLCKKCLTKHDMKILHTAFREHLHKGDTKRIFPVPVSNFIDFEKNTQNLTKQNQWMSLWFYGKCQLDSSWCI